jgi:uncharacterized protein YgbK (DUF1537 family)
MDKIVIIADDLTGAADTGVQFCPFFDETVLVPYHQLSTVSTATHDRVSQAMSIYTNSRALQVASAHERLRSVASPFSQSKPKWIYKKVDSCLRGNLGAEIEAVMDTLGFELSVIAPAFPEMGRTTVNDIHQVHGIPVSQTEISRDAVTPVTASRLSQVVAQQSRYPVGHVALDFLQGDQIRLQKEIERLAGLEIRHVVFDSTSQDHLDNLARFLLGSNRRVLPVGSAGLAASLGHLLAPRPNSKKYENRAKDSGNYLLVSGTASQVTRRQIEALVQTYPYEQIILEGNLLTDQRLQDSFLQKASSVSSVLSSKNVIIRIGSPSDDHEINDPIKRLRIANLVVEGLGRFVATVLKHSKPGFLFVTGGDTADAVLIALKGSGIRINGEVVTGMVAGRLFGGPMNGLAIITKAGAFGKADALVVLHEAWEKIQGETA